MMNEYERYAKTCNAASLPGRYWNKWVSKISQSHLRLWKWWLPIKQFYKMKLREIIKLFACHLGPVSVSDDMIADYVFEFLLYWHLVLDAHRKKFQVIFILDVQVYLSQCNTWTLMMQSSEEMSLARLMQNLMICLHTDFLSFSQKW